MMVKEVRNIVSLLALAVIYVVFSLRYFPGNIVKTAVETLLQVVSIAPLPGGATLILVHFLQRGADQKMPWDRIARIYLTLGVMLELLLGFYDYYLKALKG